jgi:hypothetical protein
MYRCTALGQRRAERQGRAMAAGVKEGVSRRDAEGRERAQRGCSFGDPALQISYLRKVSNSTGLNEPAAQHGISALFLFPLRLCEKQMPKGERLG